MEFGLHSAKLLYAMLFKGSYNLIVNFGDILSLHLAYAVDQLSRRLISESSQSSGMSYTVV
jgi:hypothetical protein